MSGKDCEMYNCTAVDNDEGFNAADSSAIAKNCAAKGNTDGFAGTWGCGTTNNASNTACDAPGCSPQTGSITFENECCDDVHLGACDSVALDNGADLSCDGVYAFSDDVDGDTRPQACSWDIGADERSAAVGTFEHWESRRMMSVP